MIRFSAFNSHNGIGHSSCESTSTRASGLQSRNSVSVRLDFDEETPLHSPLKDGPGVTFSNLFLRKERKNLSDSTPSRKTMQNSLPEKKVELLKIFRKNLNDQSEVQDSSNTGSFLPKFGSSESIQLENESNHQKDKKEFVTTLTSTENYDDLLEANPSSNSLVSQFKPHRSLSGF